MRELEEKFHDEEMKIQDYLGIEDSNDPCATTNLSIVNSTEFIMAEDMGDDDDDYNPGF